MPTPGQIADALTEWVYRWGLIAERDPRGRALIRAFQNTELPHSRPDPFGANLRRLAEENLRRGSQDAATDLAATLQGIGLRAVPDDAAAHAFNRAAAPLVDPITLRDLLTPLQDLRTHGGTAAFDPARTFRSVAVFIRALRRRQQELDVAAAAAPVP